MNTTENTVNAAPQVVAYDITPAISFGRKAQSMALSAKDFAIDSPELLEMASEDLRAVKGLQKQVEESRTSITEPLNKALKAVNDLFRAPKEYLIEAESSLKKSITVYHTAEQQKAEAARLEAERKSRAAREELERQAAEARKAAEEAKASGDTELAESIAQEADLAETMAAVAVVAPTVTAPKLASGMSSRKAYTLGQIDLRVLLQAVLDGTAPAECIQADEKFLGAQARAFKKAGILYPGVTVEVTSTLSARS